MRANLLKKIPKRCIVLAKDEKSFIGYHFEQSHPYELTRPVPPKKEVVDSHMKVDSKNMFTTAPNLEQLQKLTYTPKRFWFLSDSKAKRDKYKDYFNDKETRKGLTS